MSDQVADYPVMPGNEDAKDERSPGVVLLRFDSDTKLTAQDCGLWWYLRNWEVRNIAGKLFWLDRAGYSISKDICRRLAKLKLPRPKPTTAGRSDEAAQHQRDAIAGANSTMPDDEVDL